VQLQRVKEKMQPIKACAPDIARIAMKEHSRGAIKYQKMKDRPLDGFDQKLQPLDPEDEGLVLR
jgi:hypothetical protein